MVSQRRIYLSLVSFLIIVLNCWPVASAKRVERTQAQHYLEHVKFLAGPELQGQGRHPGTGARFQVHRGSVPAARFAPGRRGRYLPPAVPVP